MKWHVAQLNVARLSHPLDSPELSGFVANLERINGVADRAPGFVWRMVSEEGGREEAEIFGDDMLVNLSVWESVEALREYVYASEHVEVMRRRKEWFLPMQTPHLVLWWIPAGETPTLAEAKRRLDALCEYGPGVDAFTFRSVPPGPASG